jgi:hypothetical protein
MTQWIYYSTTNVHAHTVIFLTAFTVKPLSTISEGTVKNKQWMWENNSFKKVIYMGNVQGPEKVNYTCVKTMHVGITNRGFTVIVFN